MIINKTILFFVLFFTISLVVKLYEFSLLNYQNYFTNQHYFNLINEIYLYPDLNLNTLMHISSVFIASPEPILGIFYLILSKLFSPNITFYISSLSYQFLIIVVYKNINSSNLKFYNFILYCLPFLLGFYEFVLISLTHRLKISICFFIFFLIFSKKKMIALSHLTLFLMLISHISSVLYLPLLLIFFIYKDKIIFQIVRNVALIYIFSLSILLFSETFEVYILLKKIYEYLSYEYLINLCFLFFILLITNFFYLEKFFKIKKINYFSFFLIIAFCIQIIGTSRYLMLLYFFFYYITLFYYSNTGITLNNLIKKPYYLFFLILWLYNISKGVLSNPLISSSYIF